MIGLGLLAGYGLLSALVVHAGLVWSRDLRKFLQK